MFARCIYRCATKDFPHWAVSSLRARRCCELSVCSDWSSREGGPLVLLEKLSWSHLCTEKRRIALIDSLLRDRYDDDARKILTIHVMLPNSTVPKYASLFNLQVYAIHHDTATCQAVYNAPPKRGEVPGSLLDHLGQTNRRDVDHLSPAYLALSFNPLCDEHPIRWLVSITGITNLDRSRNSCPCCEKCGQTIL